MLCEGLGSEREAVALAHRVREVVGESLVVAGREVSLSACVGVACADRVGVGAEALIRDAGRAVGRAKRGGSGVELFESGMWVQVLGELEVEHGLRHAVERGQLRLHYQPEVAVVGGRAFSLEALLRWEHPERGLLGPGEFIGLAEESGLIVPIGEWVIGEACRALAGWRREGRVGEDLTVSVNLSARQLGSAGLVGVVVGRFGVRVCRRGCCVWR